MNAIQQSKQELYDVLNKKTGWGKNEFKQIMDYVMEQYDGGRVLRSIQKELTTRLQNKTGWGRNELRYLINEVYCDVLCEEIYKK